MTDPARPLYQQLADELEGAIRAGRYAPGARIPSEHELADQHGIGRPTVRQATDTLIARGVLIRRRGSGTYVRGVPASVDLFSLGGTMLSFEASGVALTTSLEGPARSLDADEAGHPFEGRAIVRLRRVAIAEGTPVVLEQLDFDATRFPGIAALDFEGRSISDVVHRSFGVRAIGADQSFRVALLDRADAAALGAKLRQPVLRVDRTLHFDRFESGVHVRMSCPDGPFVFSQRIGGNHA